MGGVGRGATGESFLFFFFFGHRVSQPRRAAAMMEASFFLFFVSKRNSLELGNFFLDQSRDATIIEGRPAPPNPMRTTTGFGDDSFFLLVKELVFSVDFRCRRGPEFSPEFHLDRCASSFFMPFFL